MGKGPATRRSLSCSAPRLKEGAPGDLRLGKGNSGPFILLVTRGLLGYVLSGPSPKTCLLWVGLDSWTPNNIETRKPLYHDKLVAQEEQIFYISNNFNKHYRTHISHVGYNMVESR